MHRMTASHSHEYDDYDYFNAPQGDPASARRLAGRKAKMRDRVERRANDDMLKSIRSIEKQMKTINRIMERAVEQNLLS